MPRTRVLSVGQCAIDQPRIAGFLKSSFDAEVAGAHTAAEAIEALRGGSFDLVLVNRIADADGASGLELIGALKADPELAPVPVMLVSNYPEAQDEAVALGAHRGFGKAELKAAETHERIAQVLR